jgi:hypothetical protein
MNTTFRLLFYLKKPKNYQSGPIPFTCELPSTVTDLKFRVYSINCVRRETIGH